MQAWTWVSARAEHDAAAILPRKLLWLKYWLIGLTLSASMGDPPLPAVHTWVVTHSLWFATDMANIADHIPKEGGHDITKRLLVHSDDIPMARIADSSYKGAYISHDGHWAFSTKLNLFGLIIGASLSEPHTSVTVLRTLVCICLSIYACLD